MNIFEKHFVMKKLPGLEITIKRIPDHQGLRDLFGTTKLLPISNDAFFYFALSMEEDPFTLPKLYTGLSYLTSDSNTYYDDYKGSYSFCFRLHVNKNGNHSEYFYNLYHYRSYIDFSVSRIVSKEDERDPNPYYPADETLFSESDIRYFSLFFCGYALGYLETSSYIPTPFVKGSESNALLFGYRDGDYFVEQYDDCDKCRERKKQLENCIGEMKSTCENSIKKTGIS